MFTCIELIQCDCAQVYLYIVALLLFNAIWLHVPDGELIVALAGTTYGPVLDPLSNSLPSDLSPGGLWEPGPVLKNDGISQGYSEQFPLKFPSQHKVI